MVERKKEIDEFSKKITYLRRLAFHIAGLHDFWKYKDVNIKSIIDHKYEELTYEEYRGYEIEGHRKLTYDERDKIDEDIYSTDGQAYLALKGLQDTHNTYEMYTEFNPQNYSLDDIVRYKEYAGSFWYFLDKSDPLVYDFDRVNKYSMNFINELYFKIMNKPIDTENLRKDIKDMFTYFDQEVFEKHAYLTSLNSNGFSSIFKNSFLNMFIFIVLLLLSIFIYVVDGSKKFNYISTLLILSVFISNTIDLTLITYQSIKQELNIKDIFSI